MPKTLGEMRAHLGKLPCGAGVDRLLLTNYINQSIDKICRSRPWTPLQKNFVIETNNQQNTGTVSATIGSTACTSAGTTLSAANNGWRIRIGNLTPYYIFTWVDATDFTIDTPFLAYSNEVLATYTCWQPVFSMPSDLAEISGIQNPNRNYQLEKWDRDRLDREAASRYLYGPPLAYVPNQDDGSGNRTIELYPGPIFQVRLFGTYRAQSPVLKASSDTLPDWFLEDAVLQLTQAKLYEQADDQARAGAMEQAAWRSVGWMAREDAARTPPQRLMQANRYTVHRMWRTVRNMGEGALRNWRSY
jgi:hypothetical protein